MFSKWIYFTLLDNLSLSYRETLPTRSIGVDPTFIVDEQRSSIKNVLETNNDSSSKSGIRGRKRKNEKDDDLRMFSINSFVHGKESLVRTRVTSASIEVTD